MCPQFGLYFINLKVCTNLSIFPLILKFLFWNLKTWGLLGLKWNVNIDVLRNKCLWDSIWFVNIHLIPQVLGHPVKYTTFILKMTFISNRKYLEIVCFSSINMKFRHDYSINPPTKLWKKINMVCWFTFKYGLINL